MTWGRESVVSPISLYHGDQNIPWQRRGARMYPGKNALASCSNEVRRYCGGIVVYHNRSLARFKSNRKKHIVSFLGCGGLNGWPRQYTLPLPCASALGRARNPCHGALRRTFFGGGQLRKPRKEQAQRESPGSACAPNLQIAEKRSKSAVCRARWRPEGSIKADIGDMAGIVVRRAALYVSNEAELSRGIGVARL